MQNAGQQYGQGGASSHQGASYGHADASSSNSGSITSSLRQFRKKDVEKQHVNGTGTPVAEAHVARVAPHNHYPPRPSECFQYAPQFPDYNLPSQVKYSEISDPQQPDQIPPSSVIQTAKGKEYMEMCNVQQSHIKQPYAEAYPAESNMHAHAAQFLQKDPQVHPSYKPESQYFTKEPPYQQLPQQMSKYNMPSQMRKYPTENDFLSKLRRIHPSMARSIMSDHHLQESQPSYQNMEQNRMYPPQNQRYVNYAASLPGNPYPHNYMPPQHYSTYPSSCTYTRPPQLGARFPSMNPHERSISPRRGFAENMPISNINYGGLPQKMSPNYPQYSTPEYSQHYQHRRAALAPQEYYQQHCRAPQYLPHQMPRQEMPENRVTVSDSIKQYIENWADEETASEMNQLESSRLCKENLRVRDDQSTETVYMINASELQYLENGIPLVTSENGIPLVASENGQYILKSGVAIDNSMGMVRLVDKTNQADRVENNADRVVNLHIMDSSKPDCMLAKPDDLNQRQSESVYKSEEKPKVVIHQNTVIQPGLQTIQHKDFKRDGIDLAAFTDGLASPLEKFESNIFKECKKETVDKNCSPINMEQMDKFDERFQPNHTSVICPAKAPDEEAKTKNMPFIDMLTEDIRIGVDEYIKEEKVDARNQKGDTGQFKTENDDDTVAEILSDLAHKNQDVKIELNGLECNADDTIENGRAEETTAEGNAESNGIEETPQSTKGQVEGDFSDTEETTNMSARSPLDAEKMETSGYAAMRMEENESIPRSSEEQTVQGETSRLEVSSEDNTIPNNNAENDTSTDTKNTKGATSKDNCSSSIPKRAVARTSIKSGNKRTSRSFSVDDIMNNIGNNFKKSKHEKESVEKRRRSLQLTGEKVEENCIFLLKHEPNTVKYSAGNEEIGQNTVEISDITGKEGIQEQEEPARNSSAEQTTDKEEIEAHQIETCADSSAAENSCGNGVKEIDSPPDNLAKVPSDTCSEQSEPPGDPEEEIKECASITEDCSNKPEYAAVIEESNVNKHASTETVYHNEVQYRNAIRIDESSVLLQIAGELVEINVNTVNGKKVITVVPLSESTAVDFNDNYEILDSPQCHDAIKSEVTAEPGQQADNVADLLAVEVVPETDVIESTSEIIIGMDISLEAEIQLDLERPPPLCTKAAKKAYDNDLQIPAITTSEDINADNKVASDVVNDKVSSSKEQSRPAKEKIEKVRSKNEERDGKFTRKSESVAAKEVERAKKIKKVKLKEAEIVDEEEFVPFKDLVKARRLKKLKLQQTSKCGDNVRADSTNKIEQEDNAATTKPKKNTDRDEKRAGEESAKKAKPADIKQNGENTGDRKRKLPSDPKSPPDADEAKGLKETNKMEKLGSVEVIKHHDKEDINITNSPTGEPPAITAATADDIQDKVPKKVILGGADFKEPGKPISEAKKTVDRLLLDRRKKSKSGGVMVPSVSEILKENEGLESTKENKRRLSLDEYIKRKRKLSITNDAQAQAKCTKGAENVKVKGKVVEERKVQRPKSLDDIKLPGQPKGHVHVKRKLSLEVTSSKPNYFDWEETQSPKTNSHCLEGERRLNEFSGLISNNKSKIVIDINDLHSKPAPSDTSEDEILQNYKDQVDSKLSSLNIQIPRPVNKPNALLNPLSSPEINDLMQRFLRNEKVTYEEMETIKQVISYKRKVQQMHKIKPQDPATSPLNPSYEIRKTCTEKDMKLHLKKVPDKLKRARFRNLHSEDPSADSEGNLSEAKKNACDYSVVQSNCFAAGVPKLIIKRKTEMPVPVVRLERLDLDMLANKKRKIY